MVTAYGTFDPYQQWLGIPPHEQPPHHYRLLGVQPFEQDVYAISAAADRLLGYLGNVTDPNYGAVASRLYEEIVNARLTLTDPYRKAQYDGWLAQTLGAPAPQTPMGYGAPPQQQYSAPAQQPQQQYGAQPGANYGAPAQYGAPSQPQYGAAQYGAQQYGAPQPGVAQYGAPQQSQPQYGAAPLPQTSAPQPAPQLQQPVAEQPTPAQQPPSQPATQPSGAANGEPEVSFVTTQTSPLMPPSRKSTLVKDHPVQPAAAGGSGITRKSTLVKDHPAAANMPATGMPVSEPAAAAPSPASAPVAEQQPGYVPSSGFTPGSYSTGAYYAAGMTSSPMQQPTGQQPAPLQPMTSPAMQGMQPAMMPMQQPMQAQYAPQPMVPSSPAPVAPSTMGAPGPEMAAPGWQVGARPAAPAETEEKQQPPWKLFGAIAAGLMVIILIGVVRNMDTPKRPQGTVAANTGTVATTNQPRPDNRVAPPPPNDPTTPEADPVTTPEVVEPVTPEPKQVEPLPPIEPEPKVEPKVEPKSEPKVEPKKVMKTEPKVEPKTEPTEPPEEGTLPSQINIPVKPVTVDPKTDPTIDPAQAKKAAEMLNKARAAMARRDISLARQRLNAAKNLPKTGGQMQEQARLEMLCDQLDDFWSAVRKTMESIKDMDDIEIYENRVGIVEVSGDKMILRVNGVNKTYHVDTMSLKLTMFLANRWYKPIPSSKIFKGAFLAMDGQGDRQMAREMWEQVKREGNRDEREVAELLLPELDVMLVTDAPGPNND